MSATYWHKMIAGCPPPPFSARYIGTRRLLGVPFVGLTSHRTIAGCFFCQTLIGKGRLLGLPFIKFITAQDDCWVSPLSDSCRLKTTAGYSLCQTHIDTGRLLDVPLVRVIRDKTIAGCSLCQTHIGTTKLLDAPFVRLISVQDDCWVFPLSASYRTRRLLGAPFLRLIYLYKTIFGRSLCQTHIGTRRLLGVPSVNHVSVQYVCCLSRLLSYCTDDNTPGSSRRGRVVQRPLSTVGGPDGGKRRSHQISKAHKLREESPGRTVNAKD